MGAPKQGSLPGTAPGRRPACPLLTLGVVAAGGSWWQYGDKGFSLLSWNRAPDSEACLVVEHIEGLLYSWKHIFYEDLVFAGLLILSYYSKKIPTIKEQRI